MGCVRSSASRNDVDIEGRRQLVSVGAKKFPAYPLEAVSGDRWPDLFGNSDPQPGAGVVTWRIYDDEVPAEKALSILS